MATATANVNPLVNSANNSNRQPTRQELERRIQQLEAEAAAAKQTAPPLSFKVSDKGAVSVYGLMRYPVTLYLSQWERLFDTIDRLKAFIEANRADLATKD